MFCEKCGQKMLDGAKFCGTCGAKQTDAVNEPKSQMAPPIQPIVQSEMPLHPQPVQPVQQPVQPQVRPVVAVQQPVQRPAAPQYQAPQQAPPIYGSPQVQGAPILSVGEYLKMFLLLCIPIVNVVLMLIWAFNNSENPNKRNYALASLLFFVIMMVVGFVLSILLGGMFFTMFSQMNTY